MQKARAQVEQEIKTAGERAVLDVGLRRRPGAGEDPGPTALSHQLRPERAEALGGGGLPGRGHRLRAGADPLIAKRAGLFHDLGKAVDFRDRWSPRGDRCGDRPPPRRIGRCRSRHRRAPRRYGAGERLRRAHPGGRCHLRARPGARRESLNLHQAPGNPGEAGRLLRGRGEDLRHPGRPRDLRDGQAGSGERRCRQAGARHRQAHRKRVGTPARSR